MPAAESYPLTSLPGIGKKRAELFANLGVENQVDLLYFFPRSYEDWSSLTPLSDIDFEGVYTFSATIANEGSLFRKGKLSWLNVQAIQDNYLIHLTYFNQPWLKNTFTVGREFIFHGKVEVKGQRRSSANPAFVEPDKLKHKGLLPIYPLSKGLTQKLIRTAVEACFNSGLHQKVRNPLPERIRDKYNFLPIDLALAKIHHPQSREDYLLARKSLAFTELFLLKTALELILPSEEHKFTPPPAQALVTTEEAKGSLTALRESLPFTLTRSQVEAINDVLRDLRKAEPMNRLLQGDVGSGKTMVAVFAAAYVAACGGQSLLMAPTSILAEQHYQVLQKYLEPLGLTLDLLQGSTKTVERREILARSASGECDLLIGTHALLEACVQFKNLVLTITDEQHRFGVKQRAKLGAQAEFTPHRLLLTATPIPRSLAMIFFNNLDMSIMREMPAGRREILTKTVGGEDLDKVYSFIRKEILTGGQAYVICPLISESESLDLASAEETYRDLSEVFPDFKIDLLHGRLSAEEKDEIMYRFVRNESQILVSTTVVEVGVDNPRATVILILGAERFGLAQLHQLRGRVGRGTRQSYCILQSDSQSEAARERLSTLVAHNDGFVLAEVDLKMRGPGDFFGTRQSGLPQFQLFSFAEDGELIDEVNSLIAEIKNLPQAERENLLKYLSKAIEERFPNLREGLIL